MSAMSKIETSRGSKWLTKLFEWFSPSLPKCKCARPRWRVMLECYPSFTKDYWECARCNQTQVFDNNQPPVKLKYEVCSLGHLHIMNGR